MIYFPYVVKSAATETRHGVKDKQKLDKVFFIDKSLKQDTRSEGRKTFSFSFWRSSNSLISKGKCFFFLTKTPEHKMFHSRKSKLSFHSDVQEIWFSKNKKPSL